MRRFAPALLIAAALAVPAALATPAAADGHAKTFVTKTSPHSVKDTMDRLAAAIEGAGAKVFARINHAEGAAKAGLTLRPATVLVFGNPKLGTPMMEANGAMALDLPMRVAAYRDAEGVVHVVYRDIRRTAIEHEVNVPQVNMAAGALDKLTNKAIAAE